MNEANYITVEEFKDWNPEIDFGQYADTTISGMIKRASKRIDTYLGYSLKIETLSDEQIETAAVSSDGDLLIFPRKIPIVSISAIKLKLGSYESSLDLTDGNGNAMYDIPEPRHYILYPYQEIQLTGKVSIRNFYDLRQKTFFFLRKNYLYSWIRYDTRGFKGCL